MKRAATGGAHRGPVGINRQRRTLRFMQVLFVLIGAGLLMLAGYSWGRSTSIEEARSGGALSAGRSPSTVQIVVLVGLGLAAFGGAIALQGSGGVKVPTPARLEELSARAQAAAIERAERVAESGESASVAAPESRQAKTL